MNKKISLLGVLLLMAIACQRAPLSELPESLPEEASWNYTFALGEGKSTMGPRYVIWEAGDIPGFYAGTTLNKAGSITVGEPCTVTLTAESALSAGTDVYGYYPYRSTAGSDPAAVTMTIPALQKQPATTYNAEAMPQIILPFKLSEAAAAGSTDLDDIHLCNLASIARFEIFSTDASEVGTKIYSVRFDSAEAGLSGDFTFDLTAVDAEDILDDKYDDLAISGLSGRSVETRVSDLPVGNSQPNAAKVWMVLGTGTFSGTVTVETNRGTYSWGLSSRSFLRNTVKVLGLDLHHAHNSALRKVEIVAGKGNSNAAGIADGIGSSASFYCIQDIIPAPDGSFWITQRGSVAGSGYAIRRFDPDTYEVTTLVKQLQTEDAEFIQYPWSGDFDENGDFWFVCKGDSDGDPAPSVGKISESSGVYTIEHITALDEIVQTYKNSMGLKFDADGNMFILCRISKASHLLKYDSELNLLDDFTLPFTIESLGVLPDRSKLLAGPLSNPANILLIDPSDGSYQMLCGDSRGRHHTGTTGVNAYTDGLPGDPFSARVRAVEGITVDSRGYIWFTEGGTWKGDNNVDMYHAVLRVLIPGEDGDYTKGTIHTMSGIPYTMGFTWTHATLPLVRGWSDLSNYAYPAGIYFRGDDLFLLEGGNGNRINRIYTVRHFDTQDGTELWSYDDAEAL